MSYCLNPKCPNPQAPSSASTKLHAQKKSLSLANPRSWLGYFSSLIATWYSQEDICQNCGSKLLLQGRYRGIRQLGQGSFGKTFEVDDGGTTKVLKVLHINNYPKVVEIFQREAKVLSHLHLSGIPRVEPDGYFTFLPGGANEPLHCLLMEKIDGHNLQEWLLANGSQPITQEQALNWLKQLVEILAQVHQHCFHRDIKPSNIMLKTDGQLALIDFGAVREITETYLQEVKRLNVTKLISPGYTPPEQYEGASVPQSDFFALGRTFVHLLTSKHPRTLSRDLAGNLIWREQAQQVSESLAQLIDDLMAIKPENRPQNTQEILERLRAVQSPRQRERDRSPLILLSFTALISLGLIGISSYLPWITIAYSDRTVKDYLAHQPTQALEDFIFALKHYPDWAKAYYKRGLIYENRREYDRARAEYRIASQGDVPEAYNNLARLYIIQDEDYTAAINLLEEGRKQAKTNKEMAYVLHKNLGWARLKQASYTEAKAQLQMAIDLASDRAAAYCLLAQVREAQKDIKGAIGEWKSCRRYASKYNLDESTWMAVADKRLADAENNN